MASELKYTVAELVQGLESTVDLYVRESGGTFERDTDRVLVDDLLHDLIMTLVATREQELLDRFAGVRLDTATRRAGLPQWRQLGNVRRWVSERTR